MPPAPPLLFPTDTGIIPKQEMREMAKPANFPERKRQRQWRARARLALMTAGKPEKLIPPHSNAGELAALDAAIGAGDRRHVRTKKDRSVSGRFNRA